VRSRAGPYAIAVVALAGAVSALWAAFAIWRVDGTDLGRCYEQASRATVGLIATGPGLALLLLTGLIALAPLRPGGAWARVLATTLGLLATGVGAGLMLSLGANACPSLLTFGENVDPEDTNMVPLYIVPLVAVSVAAAGWAAVRLARAPPSRHNIDGGLAGREGSGAGTGGGDDPAPR